MSSADRAHEVALRPAARADETLLTHVLRLAADPSGPGLTLEQVVGDQALARYVQGWGRPGDTGVIAEAPGGRLVGAAWARTSAADDRGYGFVAPGVPELAMAVGPAWRGLGWGGAMLDALLARLREQGVRSASLSVRDANVTARALYEARGFTAVGRHGESATMLLVL